MAKFNREKVLRQLEFKRKWRSYSRYVYIAVPCVLCCLLCLYFAYSKFFVSEEQAVIRTTVGDFIYGDVVIGAYIDGQYSSTIPSKNDGYAVEKVVCDNGAVGEWNNDDWGLLTTNLSKRTKCNVYFKKYSITDKITELAQSDTVNFASDDPDNNIRYIGADPDNYVYFNCSDYNNQSDSTCEKWRIIGLFNNITKSDGTKENLIKIIRDDSIGNIAWDAGKVNDWTTSSLQQNLNNGDYYNTALKNDNTRNAIENVVWNLGGSSTTDDVTASMFYERERGTTVYDGGPTTWTGKIGLMYPSDYGYATSGGQTSDRATCLANVLHNWEGAAVSDCKTNDYLLKRLYQWTLTPFSSIYYIVFLVIYGGSVSANLADSSFGVHPALFLKSSISISGGTGSSTEPYQLKLY